MVDERANCHPAPPSQLVDLVLNILFRQAINAPKGSLHAVYPGKPNHILSLGYAIHTPAIHSAGMGVGDNDRAEYHVLPGALTVPLVNRYPNSHVNTLKSRVWQRLLRVVGDAAMVHLLLGTSVFVPVGGKERGTYYQLSGERFFSFTLLLREGMGGGARGGGWRGD